MVVDVHPRFNISTQEAVNGSGNSVDMPRMESLEMNDYATRKESGED